jgi:hypothetical protein
LHVTGEFGGTGDTLTPVDTRHPLPYYLEWSFSSPYLRLFALHHDSLLRELPFEFEMRGDDADRHERFPRDLATTTEIRS